MVHDSHSDAAAGLYKYCIWPAMADTRLRRSDYCGAMVTSLSPGPYMASLDKTRSDRLMTIVCGLRHTYLGRSEGPALYGVMACRLFISHRQHLLQQIYFKVVRGELFSGSIC